MSIDVAPTLLKLASVKVLSEMHGRSLVLLFKENGAQLREAFLTEYFAEAKEIRAELELLLKQTM